MKKRLFEIVEIKQFFFLNMFMHSLFYEKQNKIKSKIQNFQGVMSPLTRQNVDKSTLNIFVDFQTFFF